MSSIAILDDYQDVALRSADWSVLPGDCEVVAFARHMASEDELAEALARFDILVAMRERTPLTASLLGRLPKLRLIVTTGRRNASIDLDAARRQGIVVCGTEGLSSTTAELTIGLILALLRHIPDEDAALRRGRWQTTLGEGLAGKTLGLIGFGNVGSRVARVGQALGMNVLAWSRNLTAERAAASGAEAAGFETVLRAADVVSVHLTLAPETRGLVSAEAIAWMKPTAFLVNTSRGPIVDEASVIWALREGRIAGFAADVYDREPLPPDAPILSAPNTVLTPHLGYVTRGTYEIYFGQAVEDISAFLAGRPVRVLAGASQGRGP